MAKRRRRDGLDKPWYLREMGGMPHWATIAFLCFLVAMVIYVMWDRAELGAEVASTPAPANAEGASVTPRASTTESAVASPAPDDGPVVVVSDSYTAGSTQDSGEEARWPALIGVEPIAVSGVGYVQGGVTFGSLAEEIPADATTVMFFGSINDSFSDYDEVREAAEEAFATARERAPDAELIVIGPPWVNADPPGSILTLRDAVSDAATAAGARWVDPIAEGWFVGDEELIGSDGIHPTDAGQAYLAERITAILAEQ